MAQRPLWAVAFAAEPDLMEAKLTENRALAPITERARGVFDPGQVELIRNTVAAGCNDGELAIFLEECARYELDPFAKQVWAIKIQGRMQIVVSRDGLLAIANRYPDFRGCQSFEVRQHDLFQQRVDEDGHVHVTHEWRDADGKPTHGGQDGALRGEVIGAFAYVRREGHVDTQFMAYRAQYDKHASVWKSHLSAMMVKVAEAMALRKAFSVSGVVGEHEVEPDRQSLTSASVEADYGEDERVEQALRDAFSALGYTQAKVRTLLRGCASQEDREALLAELQDGIPVEAEVVDGEAQ